MSRTARAPASLLFAITAVAYGLVWSHWHGVFSTLIPVGAFLAIPTWNALAGNTEHSLERTAEQFWGLMVSTYCLSYAPALLMLDIPGYAGRWRRASVRIRPGRASWVES